MRELLWMYPKVVSDEYCDKIIDICKDLNLQDGVIGAMNQEEKIESVRRSQVAWVNDYEIHEMMYDLGMKINRDCFGFDLYPSSFNLNSIQFTQYSSDDLGKYDWHIDNGPNLPFPGGRKLSLILQLTDPSEYEGGNVEFRIGPETTEMPPEYKNKGTLIGFPSFALHRVTPVTKGKRNSLVSWMEGPSFR